uniref:Uncharacterized protein n=3 Tax=unclassified bacterial viruses TaxID=12333 RepID=A0AAU6VZH7_9VIRU
MLLALEPFPKTMPSNHQVREFDFENPEAVTIGGTLDAEAWAKCSRQADPNYDWYGYTQSVNKTLFDHPDFAHREHEAAQKTEWNQILKDLEPFNPRAV